MKRRTPCDPTARSRGSPTMTGRGRSDEFAASSSCSRAIDGNRSALLVERDAFYHSIDDFIIEQFRETPLPSIASIVSRRGYASWLRARTAAPLGRYRSAAAGGCRSIPNRSVLAGQPSVSMSPSNRNGIRDCWCDAWTSKVCGSRRRSASSGNRRPRRRILQPPRPDLRPLTPLGDLIVPQHRSRRPCASLPGIVECPFVQQDVAHADAT